MQKIYGRNQIPDLRKKIGYMEYLGLEYLDPKSCMVIFFIFMNLSCQCDVRCCISQH